MKKTWMAVVAIVLMSFTLTACGSSAATENSQKTGDTAKVQAANTDKNQMPQQEGKRKILVAYFSNTGHTKSLAQNAADVLQADLYEIMPEVPYTSKDLNYNDESTRATVEQKNVSARPAISGKAANFDTYNTIVIAYPIWWGQAPRIIDTFMESYDFSNKTIVPICTSASSDIGSSADALHALCSNSAKWLAGKRFSADASKNEVNNWFAALKLSDKN